MVSIEELKGVYVLGKLTEGMLAKILPITQFRQFEEGEVVFKRGQTADNFYILKSGKVLVEAEVLDGVTISLGSIKPGYSFGWSALLAGGSYTTDAVCVEPSDILAMSADSFRDLLNEDHEMGYFVMEHTARTLNGRLKRRTRQILKVLSNHPELKDL